MGRNELDERFARQIRRWQIERGAGMPLPRGAVVSISQMPWSGGDEVARQVASWLDYGLFDIETVRAIAADPELRKRLATALLPPARTLRVLVVAGTAMRAGRLARARGLDPEQAAAALAREDAARLEFLRTRLGIAGDDPTLYDLTLNTERLTLDAAAALVVEALRRQVPPLGKMDS